MAATKYTTLANLAEDISTALGIYRSAVLQSIADHMDECAEVFIDNAKREYADGGSPYDDNNHLTKHYRECWKVKKLRKAKYVRYIGNTKKVKAHYRDSEPTIPLINILEFRKDNRARPHVARILNDSQDKIFGIIADNIKKEGK